MDLARGSVVEAHPDGVRVADLKFDDVGREHEFNRIDGGHRTWWSAPQLATIYFR